MNVIRRMFLVITCLLSWSILNVEAQDFIQLQGVVMEEGNDQPIPYATVRVKGFPLGTITNLSGRFSFWLSSRYKDQSIVFSSVGYLPYTMKVQDLLKEENRQIRMKVDVKQLANFTVVSKREFTGLDVLKRAVARIPENYRNQQQTFDAYYRERITENGAVIRYADAAITFDQSPYDGERYKKGNFGSQQLVREGPWLGGYNGLYRIGDRLHDHFGHRTSDKDKVQIHEIRASLNQTREDFRANIEAGPLGTLGKDLVKYIAYFIDKRDYHKYQYDLAEVPDRAGGFDYLVQFKPKRAAKQLEEDLSIVGGKIRDDIFTGEIYITKDTYVIKQINYRVAPKYRAHICSLGQMQIIHYGYRVNIDYASTNGRWQMKSLKRVDEFLFPDTIKQTTTPYEAISEIVVTKPVSSLRAVPASENFANRNSNYFLDYHGTYNPGFWSDYEKEVKAARLTDSLRQYMEESLSLEEQFAQRSQRDHKSEVRKAQVRAREIERSGTQVIDDYHWLQGNGAGNDYLTDEDEYAKDYLKPLGKTINDLALELKIAHDKSQRLDTTAKTPYRNWSQFKNRSGNRKLLKGRKQYNVKVIEASVSSGGTVPVTLIFMGDGRGKALPKRPIIIKAVGVGNTGGRLSFDASIIPMLQRGVIFAYVHLRGAGELSSSSYLEGNMKQRDKAVRDLMDAVNHLKVNQFCKPNMVLLSGKGIGGAIVLSAINKDPELCLGAFFEEAQVDPVNAVFESDDLSIVERVKGWNERKTKQLTESLTGFSPYENIKAQAYPRMAFFIRNDQLNSWQSAKTVAKLRAIGQGNNTLLLNRDSVINEITVGVYNREIKLRALKYALIFQWFHEVQKAKGLN